MQDKSGSNLELIRTGENRKSGSEMAQKKRFPKTYLKYWEGRLEKRSYSSNGIKTEIPEWHIRLASGGRRQYFNLETSNKEAAAQKARKIWTYLQANGFDATLAEFKPSASATVQRKEDCTVGEFLTEVSAKSGLRAKTFVEYAKGFRQLVSQIHSIDTGTEKYDYVNGGRERWRAKVDAAKLKTITPARVQRWKIAYLAKAGHDPLILKSKRVTLNKILRNAKALFAPKVQRFLEVELPQPLPFDGIDFEKEGSLRYHSEIKPELLIVSARNELAVQIPSGIDETKLKRSKENLAKARHSGASKQALKKLRRRVYEVQHAIEYAESKNEQYKILLLALLAGLRRKEIDLLEWRSIDFERHVIRIEPTRYFQPKTEDSGGEIEVDGELVEALRGYYPEARDIFVINSEVPPNPAATYEHYRCERDFDRLTKWLREKGITANNPLHALRKEFGSIINAKAGIFEASRLLRHSSTQVTERHYLDSRRRITSGLGHLIANPDYPRAAIRGEVGESA